jgi:uncharacterized protein (DUF362 family)
MDRREFLKMLGRFSVAAGMAALAGGRRPLFAQAYGTSAWDIAAVMGGEPGDMFDAGIASFGGMSSFVKPGQSVCIKVNASWNAPPERGATTSPSLVERIVRRCREAGASRVYVLDHTIENAKLAFSSTGIEEAARSGGAQIVPANSKGYYQELSVPGAQRLQSVMVHELLLESDVFINVPILKHHGSTTITSAMKNLMGVIWDRSYYHANDLHRCIAEFPLLIKPDLNVVDAYTVMNSGGPRGFYSGSDLSVRKMQIISPDIVAVDAASARTWGTEPGKVRYIELAKGFGLGESNLEALRINRIRV